MTKIFVSNFPYTVTEDQLRVAMELQFGEVTETRIIKDRETGNSRGFGFVTFALEPSAERALTMDGAVWHGRKLTVRVATEKPARPAERERETAPARRY